MHGNFHSLLCSSLLISHIQAVHAGCPCGFSLQMSSCKCKGEATNTTPVCPTNYYFDEYNCECKCNRIAECPTNYEWDKVECGCFCDHNVTCPTHFKWDVSKCQCMCTRLCPYGKELDESLCTCKCTNSCRQCELQNPSDCTCEVYNNLVAARQTHDTSVKAMYYDVYKHRYPY